MRHIFGCLLLIVLLSIDQIYCDEELEASENWGEIVAEICKNELPNDKQTELEKCRELDPYYQLDVSYIYFNI